MRLLLHPLLLNIMLRFFIFLFMLVSITAQAQEPAPAFIPAPSEAHVAAAPKAAAPTPSLLGGKGGDEAIDITADKSLEWHENERVYIASGHAKAKKGDVTIEADTLKAYDRKKADGSSEVWRMTAEGNVHVIGKAQDATGETAEYDIDSKKAVLKGKNLKFTTATDTVTASDSLEFWENDNKAIARGNTLAVREGRQVRADVLIAQFKKDAKGDLVADTMEAKGNVHITSAKDVVTCDEALYRIAPNNVTLTGNVFITQGANQLKGDKVEADFKTGLSKIMNVGKGRVHALIRSSKGTPDEKRPDQK